MDGQIDNRIAAIKAKIKARTAPDGTPRRGFEKNVELCRAELARLEELQRGRQEAQN